MAISALLSMSHRTAANAKLELQAPAAVLIVIGQLWALGEKGGRRRFAGANAAVRWLLSCDDVAAG
jgi:hypothetical protein